MLGTRFAVFVTADIPNEAINAFLETNERPSDGQALRLVDHEQFLALWPHVDNSPERREDRSNVGWRSSYIGLGMDGCAAKLRTWAHKQPLLNPDYFLALDKNLTDYGMVRCCKVLERSEARGKSSAPVQSSSGASAANMSPADIAAHFQGRLPRSSVYMPLPPALRPRMVDAQPVQEYLLSVALARQWPSVAKDRQLLDYMSHQPPVMIWT
ncbi:hypothetical protein EJ03DRAFT_354776 [Teratosphaeria nubilosa]|uniref:Uncharacterized protein n=1 Tax=Teratosphaeria nubilosa TaxID=161662 RepID=A0A6G1KY57_9PEZI|nr:hypothetical protein EJ03DRAFT_354776 [Teratosphaeria nubilosa]